LSRKTPYYPPEPFVEDIDTTIKVDCDQFDDLIFACVNIGAKSLREDIKDIEKDSRGYRFVLENLLVTMKDIHTVIRKIYKDYSKDAGPEQLCAFPLARQQLELVFILAILLQRDEKILSNYEKSSLIDIYKRFIYESEETRRLSRFKTGTDARKALLLDRMKGKSPSLLLSPFTDDEVKQIEGFVLKGEKLKLSQFPRPKDIISCLSENQTNESLVKILLRLYVEYEWLCNYTHFSFWSNSSRAVLTTDYAEIDKERYMENETRQPIVARSYLALLIAITDVSLFIRNPVTLRAKLCDAWAPFEKADFLGKFIWDNWSKHVMGVLFS